MMNEESKIMDDSQSARGGSTAIANGVHHNRQNSPPVLRIQQSIMNDSQHTNFSSVNASDKAGASTATTH